MILRNNNGRLKRVLVILQLLTLQLTRTFETPKKVSVNYLLRSSKKYSN